MKKLSIEPGSFFGRWTVVSESLKKDGGRFFHCQCQCGSLGEISMRSLRAGASTSCGCHRNELTSKRMKSHGDTNSSLYRSWAGMLQRCENANNKDYARYGGRGIKVADRWRDFANFRADMEGTFNSGLEIDRYPDNNGNYEPGNCRWATAKQNSRNQEKTVVVDWNGEKVSLCTLAEQFGQTPKRVYQRHVTYGWPLDRALQEVA